MENLNPPTPMQFSGNPADNWKRFNQRLNAYLSASGAGGDENPKASIFLHVIEDARNDQRDLTLTVVMTKFEDYFMPSANFTFERYKFFSANQNIDVSFSECEHSK